MAIKKRSDLKAAFSRGAIPKESDFSDVFDSFVVRDEDGLSKSADSPLALRGAGSGETVLKLYRTEANGDAAPAWQFSQVQADKVGLSIADGAGQCRLFIDEGTGKIGVGTTEPSQVLDVRGTIQVKEEIRLDAADKPLITRDWNPFNTEVKGGAGRWGLFMEPARLFVGVPGDDYGGTSYIGLGGWKVDGTREDWLTLKKGGNVGIGTAEPRCRLEVVGGISRLEQEDWKSVEFSSIEVEQTIGPNVAVPSNVSVRGVWASIKGKISWEDYSNEYGAAGYFRDSAGIVHVRGLVKMTRLPSGRSLADIPVFTLPEGYRPSQRQVFCVQTHPDTAGRVDIKVDGQIVVVAGSPSWVSISGINFRAA